jgi:hypothetical protein
MEFQIVDFLMTELNLAAAEGIEDAICNRKSEIGH